ncbi:zinc dependent phospholipase C family protein [Eremococcus coleocola]|uniref:zinc dependent phospholipase C family protein n=1 Tax=Eremococcus coleocola TaxID=88132 RepID=UPI0004047628|nr:zinc dependent phospholipase C family protein [Eremococcus coleocola]
MPSIYTHHRFGRDLVDYLKPELKNLAILYPDLYELGQQGPDIFFAHPRWLMRPDSLGMIIHNHAGKDYLNRQKSWLKNLGLNSPQAAYLLGTMCHYILDSKVHPLVDALSEPNDFTHLTVETELDRYFLEVDGYEPTQFNPAQLIPRKKTYRQLMNDFYYSYGLGSFINLQASVAYFRMIKHLFYSPNPIKGEIFLKIFDLVGKKASYNGLIMQVAAFPQASQSNPQLVAAYEASLRQAPDLLANAFAYIFEDQPLLADFNLDYNGQEIEHEG